MTKNAPSFEWTTLATFNWLQGAVLLRCRLEAAGISAQIPEEYTASIHPMATVMQVRVLVRSADLSRAQEILELTGEEDGEGKGEETLACTVCGGKRFRRKSARIKNFFMIFAAMISGVPVRRIDENICNDCGQPQK